MANKRRCCVATMALGSMLFLACFTSLVVLQDSFQSVTQSRVARRSPATYLAKHLDHLAPALWALPRTTMSVSNDIHPETAANSVFLASGHWVPAARWIQLLHPSAKVVVVSEIDVRQEGGRGQSTNGTNHHPTTTGVSFRDYCKPGKVLINFMFPQVAEAWVKRHGAACARAGAHSLLLPALPTLRKFESTKSFSQHMQLKHPRWAVQTFNEPVVPCVVKNTSRDGNGKGVTLIETSTDLEAWREMYRVRVHERGWQGLDTNLVIQEPVLGHIEYGVSVVCCRGVVLALAAYKTTAADQLFVYGAGTHEQRTEAVVEGNDDGGVGKLPPEVTQAVKEIVENGGGGGGEGLNGFVNFDIKLRNISDHGERGGSGGVGGGGGGRTVDGAGNEKRESSSGGTGLQGGDRAELDNSSVPAGGRPAFLEANMRMAGAWFKTGTIGKAVEAYYQCSASSPPLL